MPLPAPRPLPLPRRCSGGCTATYFIPPHTSMARAVGRQHLSTSKCPLAVAHSAAPAATFPTPLVLVLQEAFKGISKPFQTAVSLKGSCSFLMNAGRWAAATKVRRAVRGAGPQKGPNGARRSPGTKLLLVGHACGSPHPLTAALLIAPLQWWAAARAAPPPAPTTSTAGAAPTAACCCWSATAATAQHTAAQASRWRRLAPTLQGCDAICASSGRWRREQQRRRPAAAGACASSACMAFARPPAALRWVTLCLNIMAGAGKCDKQGRAGGGSSLHAGFRQSGSSFEGGLGWLRTCRLLLDAMVLCVGGGWGSAGTSLLVRSMRRVLQQRTLEHCWRAASRTTFVITLPAGSHPRAAPPFERPGRICVCRCAARAACLEQSAWR
mgnify:CR=1 FL=1